MGHWWLLRSTRGCRGALGVVVEHWGTGSRMALGGCHGARSNGGCREAMEALLEQ